MAAAAREERSAEERRGELAQLEARYHLNEPFLTRYWQIGSAHV